MTAERNRPAAAELKDCFLELQPELTERRDARALLRLVQKYGQDRIITAVIAARPPRKRGGQLRGFKPIYEAIHLAEWFDSVVEDYRNKGSTKPSQEAWSDLYKIACEWGKQHPRFKPGRFETWRKNFQKKRSLGQRHLEKLKRELAREQQQIHKRTRRK